MDQAVWLSALGALLALDTAMVGQLMIAQPLVVGGIFGWLLGDLAGGLLLGSMVQLLWIGVLPVGAFVPSDHAVTGGIAVALAGLLHRQQGLDFNTAAILALALSIPAGFLSGKLDILVRHLNSRIAGRGERAVERWGCLGIDGLNLAGLAAAFLRNFVVYFIWLGPVAVLAALASRFLPNPVLRGLGAVYWVLPLLGLAVILETVMKEKSFRLIGVVFAATWATVWLLPQHGLAIFGWAMVAGAVYVGWRRSW